MHSDRSDQQRTPYTWPDEVRPTDEQVAAWLTICTPEERIERVRWWREQANRAWDCTMQDHYHRRNDEARRRVSRALDLIDSFDPTCGSGRTRAFVNDLRQALLSSPSVAAPEAQP